MPEIFVAFHFGTVPAFILVESIITFSTEGAIVIITASRAVAHTRLPTHPAVHLEYQSINAFFAFM